MFENIYDLIKGGMFEEEAKKEIRQMINGKEISWDGDRHEISIGEHFTIALKANRA